jgi:hypothetical protein
LIGEAASDVPQDKYTDDYINIELNLPADQQKIEAHAEFVEFQPVIEEREFSQTVPLKWGVPFDFESPTFNITIKPLDGPEVVLTETQKENGYFKVTEFEGKHQLIAIPPVQA